MIVAKKIDFDAAHRLPGYVGKCGNLHGHRWTIELAVDGPVNPDTGMVADFTILKNFLEGIKEELDHKLLNEIIENPTAENICDYISHKEATRKDSIKLPLKVAWIKVSETPDSYAVEWYKC